MKRHWRGVAALALVSATAACELTEVDIVDYADVFVVEAFVTVADTPTDNGLRVFIHGTGPDGSPSTGTYGDAEVAVTDADGSTSVLVETAFDECVADAPDGADGSCFAADAVLASGYESGDSLSIAVSLADGRDALGTTTIPGSFVVDGIAATCRLSPDTRLPLTWSRSSNAWAYLNEAVILGLQDPLRDEGIEASDSLHLLGLSISESDTTVSFPNEFGVFDRFDLDRDLAVRLQRGLPDGVRAEVAITAVDRNYVNWVRGGSFNPSGAVRISSLVGDGSGVFGSAVTRRFTVVSSSDTAVAPPCGSP